MRKMELCKMSRCLWGIRFEILGVILLVIGTVLTISSGSGLGIIALFASGIVLCLSNKFCYSMCSPKQASCPICDDPDCCCCDKSTSMQNMEEIQAEEAMDNEGGNQLNRKR